MESQRNTDLPQVSHSHNWRIFIHYVFDLWVQAWRDKVATGDLTVVRYADDLVVGFESRAEAERFLKDSRERLAKFGLKLHPEKTR
jgi:RNA-directed DNA polymerase